MEKVKVADFCKQCSVELFGEDTKDLAGLISQEDAANGLGALAICEDCGNPAGILVNDKGECLGGNDCRKHGESA
jgi:hypothetical protein